MTHYDVYNMAIIKTYLLCLNARGMKREYPEPMPIKGKDELRTVLPSCPICGSSLDLKLLETFGSRRTISDDGKSYYCNNPMCAPEEEELKHRLLPFSWNSHHPVSQIV
jgi:hypothetical protein